MSGAIVIRNHGSPEVMVYEEVEVRAPSVGQIRVANAAIGVNYHDVYVRSGLYKTLRLPGTPGLEGVGVVEAVGPGVSRFRPGDRVAYLDPSYGSYARYNLVAEDRVVSLPPTVDDGLAAATLLKGLTAGALVTQAHPLAAGMNVVVHAAAGGVGHILSQWAAHLGARVIGTVGSRAKAGLARELGCEDVLVLNEHDVVAEVLARTGGKGADVVFDAVGADTFDRSLAMLAMRGHLVNYGQASGPVPPFDLSRLAPRSASVTRAGYAHYMPDPDALQAMADSYFGLVQKGTIQPRQPIAFPLQDAAAAHAALENRAVGPFILST